MKVIIKKFMSQETPIELNIEDPSKITIAEFAQIYLERLSKRYVYVLEPTEYTIRNNVIGSDFIFYISGRSYSASKFRTPDKLLSEALKKSQLENNAIVTIHANLNVYGKQNYLLRCRKTPPSLFNLCLFKMQDMIDEGSVTKEDIKNGLPHNDVLPEAITKLIK
jgi:hypothetical protein